MPQKVIVTPFWPWGWKLVLGPPGAGIRSPSLSFSKPLLNLARHCNLKMNGVYLTHTGATVDVCVADFRQVVLSGLIRRN